jgi:hypothetical protein
MATNWKRFNNEETSGLTSEIEIHLQEKVQ